MGLSSRRLGIGLAIVVCAVGWSYARAQGTRADYDRAELLARKWQGKVTTNRVEPRWYAPDHFYYRNDLGDGNWTFVNVDCAASKKGTAFDHAKLAEALTKAAGNNFAAEHLPLEGLEFSADGKSLTFDASGSKWACDLESYTIEKKGKATTTTPTTTSTFGQRRGG